MRLELPGLIRLLGYGIALLGAGSLLPYLPLLPRLALLVGLAAGLYAEHRRSQLIPPLALTIISTALFLWYAAQFSRANPVLPVVSILAVLLGARLAAEKTVRTWLQTSAIALFCLSSSTLFDLGPRFLLLLMLMLPLLALLLVLLTFQAANQPLSRASLRQAALTGLLIPVAALVFTPLFFPILPRTHYPLWNLIQQTGGSQPAGLADTVTPGRSAQVSESGPLVFRAEMPRIPANQLYWRGPVFSRLEGLRWQQDPPAGTAQPASAPATRLVQTITMEPGASRSLIGLDLPLSFSHANGNPIPSASWNRPLPASRRLRYQVASAFAPAPPAPPLALAGLTRLPDEAPQRIRQLAEQFRLPDDSDQKRLASLEGWFRTSGFRYSRTDLPTGDDALERFLFESKSGHCEFFASGFALLARGAGLPARLVGGYYGGEYNELGGYYRVSEERAHVWVEVWLNGTGWQRIDPSSFAANADAALGEPRQRSLRLRLRMLIDSLDYLWNSAVITYDFERQLQTAATINNRLQALKLRDFGVAGAMLAASVAVVLGWLLLRKLRRSGRLNRNTRLLRRFRRALEKSHGIPCDEPLGLLDLAKRVDHPGVHEFVRLYARSLYGNQLLSRSEFRQLKRLVRQGFDPP